MLIYSSLAHIPARVVVARNHFFILVLDESNVLINIHPFGLFNVQEKLLCVAPYLCSRTGLDVFFN